MKVTLKIYQVECKRETGWIGNGSCLFPGHKVSLWLGKKVLNIDGGDGWETMWIYLMIFKNGLKSVT